VSPKLPPQGRPQQKYNNPSYGGLPNGAAPPGNGPAGAQALLPNQGRVVETGGVRILCIADVRGERASFHGNN
jgi:hypothetical protein